MSEVINELLHSPSAASAEGVEARNTPQILLGQFERVGSTFLLDELEKGGVVHNEPYKLLVPTEWPISRAYDGKLMSVDEFFEDPSTSPTAKHWFRNFVASLHHPGDQIVKETNLFLALPQFLESFPDSSIQLLTRNPMGIISSFKRNGLYKRWGYEDIRGLLHRQLEHGKPENYQPLQHMVEQQGQWHERLAWLVGFNALLLSRHVDPESVERVIDYERDVIPLSTEETVANDRVQDSIFATNIKKTHDDYEARFSDEEIRQVSEAMKACAKFVTTEFDASDLYWFEQLYGRHLDGTRSSTHKAVKPHGKVSAATQAVPMNTVTTDESLFDTDHRLVRLSPDQPVLWDHSLITNEEMANFMQLLLENGYDPSDNFMLLLDNMPVTRGGRIGFDVETSQFEMAEGYEQHPAYWMGWIAASLYAYKQGMRLPSYAEWEHVFSQTGVPADETAANFNYAHDDVVPTGQGAADLPNDFFGNLKIWCADWSNPTAVSKKLAGISWKQYYQDDYRTEGERPYLTNSRIIGARLVCCAECAVPQPRTMAETVEKFSEVLRVIEGSSVVGLNDLTVLNKQISDILTPTPCEHNTLEEPTAP